MTEQQKMEEWLIENGYKKTFHDYWRNEDDKKIRIDLIDGMAIVTRFERINCDNVKQLQSAITALK